MDWCTHKLNKGTKDVLIKLIFKENLLLTGSAADVCEVLAKDEIISINNRDIGIMTQAMVRKVIDDANRKGELELCVRRYRNTG